MCDEPIKRSEFYKDEEKQKEACVALAEMKKVRERRGPEMTTVILPNGARISSTNTERLREYERHCKKTSGNCSKYQ